MEVHPQIMALRTVNENEEDFPKPNAMAEWLASIVYDKFTITPSVYRSQDEGIILAFYDEHLGNFDIEVYNDGSILTAVTINNSTKVESWNESTLDDAVRYVERAMNVKTHNNKYSDVLPA